MCLIFGVFLDVVLDQWAEVQSHVVQSPQVTMSHRLGTALIVPRKSPISTRRLSSTAANRVLLSGWKSVSCSLDGTFKGSPPTCDGDFHNLWDLFLLYPLLWQQWFIICNIIPNRNGGRITNRALNCWFIMIVFIGDSVFLWTWIKQRSLLCATFSSSSNTLIVWHLHPPPTTC